MILGKEKVTGGGSSDMKYATKISTAMVQQLGMSDKVGLRVFSTESLAKGLCSDNTKGEYLFLICDFSENIVVMDRRTLPRNKRFLLKFLSRQNASKFAIFYV